VHQDAVEKVSEQAMDKNVIPENMIGKSGCSIKIDQVNGSDSNEAIIIDSSCSTIKQGAVNRFHYDSSQNSVNLKSIDQFLFQHPNLTKRLHFD
jgi:hypothetical protein